MFFMFFFLFFPSFPSLGAGCFQSFGHCDSATVSVNLSLGLRVSLLALPFSEHVFFLFASSEHLNYLWITFDLFGRCYINKVCLIDSIIVPHGIILQQVLTPKQLKLDEGYDMNGSISSLHTAKVLFVFLFMSSLHVEKTPPKIVIYCFFPGILLSAFQPVSVKLYVMHSGGVVGW